MSNTIIIAVIVVILIKIGIFAWLYLFNIYETRILVNPKFLTTNINSIVELKVIPLNSFGKRALLRNISAEFEIISEDSLVKVTERISDKITLQSLGELGKVEILAIPQIGMFPTKIIIEIVEDL